jgi:hypothetical protein
MPQPPLKPRTFEVPGATIWILLTVYVKKPGDVPGLI